MIKKPFELFEEKKKVLLNYKIQLPCADGCDFGIQVVLAINFKIQVFKI